MIEARIVRGTDSQSYVLRLFLQREGVTHGDEFRATLESVHVRVPDVGEQQLVDEYDDEERVAAIFFCNMSDLKVNRVITQGDGASLPRAVVVRGLEVKNPGRYDICNALVRSNGILEVIVDKESEIMPSK